MSADGPTIELLGVSRRYGSFVAVDDASLSFTPGEIHAVIGENGAGKSTLLKMAAGVLAPSAGEVRVAGAALGEKPAREAAARGVGMVHQHFMLVAAFSAIENLVLGSEPLRSLGRLDLDGASVRARELMRATGMTVPLEAITSSLTVGQRQRLEILRVLSRGARAILLDEPTAVLSPLEAEDLYATLRRLAAGGATLVVVTHRLDEVSRHADAVTVMRRGRVVRARGPASAEVAELTLAIMGGSPPPAFAPKPLAEDAKVALAVKGLRLAGAGHAKLDGVDLEVRAGEIVGIAGVEGNGQRELVRALAGLEPRATGEVTLGEIDLMRLDLKARRARIGVVHEDRHAEGLVLEATVSDNLVLGELDELGPRESEVAGKRLTRSGVQPPDPARVAGALSGGNQQKIVIERVLDRFRASGGPRAVVLAQPTRGVDVGAAAAIHAAIGEAASSGLAVLVVSADLAELRRLSHRIVVMRDGRVVASFAAGVSGATETELGRAMLGVE